MPHKNSCSTNDLLAASLIIQVNIKDIDREDPYENAFLERKAISLLPKT